MSSFRTNPDIVRIEVAAEPVEAGGPVGIVVEDPQQAIDYLASVPGGLPTDYHIIRSIKDVPARLGGLALLGSVALTPELIEALSAALLPTEGGH